MALATLAILSIGDMGLGVAKLLLANNYRVLTNASDRSQATKDRAKGAGVQLVSSDEELATKSDYILSIVPPRDALSIAQRILTVSSLPSFRARERPLYYLDLNAISPRSAREIEELFKPESERLRFIDGGIIGGPPKLSDNSEPSDDPRSWIRPSIPMSGPYPLSEAQPSGAHLADVLNSNHIASEIGQASGLKMCFASLTKGMTALAIQSFTTAHRLGVVTELQNHLEHYSPKTLALAHNGLTGMPPKAYRWVREMAEIGDTFAEDGGFNADENIFSAVSKTYDLVAYGTELGNEKTGARVRGKTAEDVAALMSGGIDKRKVKTE